MNLIQKKVFSLFTLLIICASCATPTVVNIIGPNDNEMDCKELSAEILKANQYADEAQQAKKVSKPHNVGAILFFIPGYGVTMKNIQEATKAAKERTLHLNKLKEKKGC
tara:strand:+ start:80 stop:406 length:327 start_codon:yes stop_codon:yes gene_type:complete